VNPGAIVVNADSARCPGKADIVILFAAAADSRAVRRIIGVDIFFGIPYRMYNTQTESKVESACAGGHRTPGSAHIFVLRGSATPVLGSRSRPLAPTTPVKDRLRAGRVGPRRLKPLPPSTPNVDLILDAV
jgi:hypothetical protein